MVVAGDETSHGTGAAARLEELGFDDIRVLEGGVTRWAADPGRPLETGIPDTVPRAFA